MLKDLFAFMPLLERVGLLDAYAPAAAHRAAAADTARQVD